MANIISAIFLLIMLGCFVGLIVLQVKLSKKQSPWPGLILPIISFLFALVVAFGFAAYSFVTSESVTVMEGDAQQEVYFEQVEGETFVQSEAVGVSAVGFVAPLVMHLLPCVVYLLIFFSCHPFKNKRAELDRMSISDL